ncbi:MAG: tetratricopeptide repeat protein [Phycisphaerales bacterium]
MDVVKVRQYVNFLTPSGFASDYSFKIMSPRLHTLLSMLEASPDDAFVLYGIAQEHAKAGNHEVACSFYDRCIAADPSYHYAYYHKAVALHEAGQDSAARAALEAGIAKARAAGDLKALSELQHFHESL